MENQLKDLIAMAQDLENVGLNETLTLPIAQMILEAAATTDEVVVKDFYNFGFFNPILDGYTFMMCDLLNGSLPNRLVMDAVVLDKIKECVPEVFAKLNASLKSSYNSYKRRCKKNNVAAENVLTFEQYFLVHSQDNWDCIRDILERSKRIDEMTHVVKIIKVLKDIPGYGTDWVMQHLFKR